MKKTILAISFLISFCGCTVVTTEAGYESVLVKKPYMFGKGGIDSIPYPAGREYAAPSTDYVPINIQPQKETEHFDDLITKDNNPVDFDVVVTYQIQSGKTPYLYEKFGLKWYSNNVAPQFRNYARDLAKGYKMFELTSDPVSANKMEDSLRISMVSLIAKQKLPVNILNITIGKINPPEEVTKETAKTAAQVQRVKTEIEREKAEIARSGAEKRKAEADKAYITAFGMTNAEYIKMRELEIEKEKIQILRDNKNATVIFGNSIPIVK